MRYKFAGPTPQMPRMLAKIWARLYRLFVESGGNSTNRLIGRICGRRIVLRLRLRSFGFSIQPRGGWYRDPDLQGTAQHCRFMPAMCLNRHWRSSPNRDRAARNRSSQTGFGMNIAKATASRMLTLVNAVICLGLIT